MTEPVKVILNLYDLQGNLLEHFDWGLMEPGSRSEKVNLKIFPDAIYLFILRIGNQDHAGRLIKISH